MPETAAVVNSGPVIALSIIRRLELLRELFAVVHLPEAVYHEVVDLGMGRPGSEELKSAVWTHRVRSEPDPLLLRELGRGEAEAIAFAVHTPGTTAVLDDKRARRIARVAYNIPFVGTAGLLVRAKRAGLILAVRPAIDALLAAGYFLSDFTVREALKAAGESPVS
ncbi:MAG: DUF3368 domain-containing protein [Planctomycetes bacterium]|nr:DUF3368 domain-containing protein [Planctomycetota bacterium]